MAPTVSITPVTEHLYYQCAGQLRPQNTYIELDLRDGSMSADYDGEIGGGVPESVWNGDVVRLPLPTPELTASTINEIMHDIVDDAQELVTAYHDGATDQRTLNDAIYCLQHRVETWEVIDDPRATITVVSPEEWFEPITTLDTATIEIDDGTVITADTTDEELGRLAAALDTDVDDNTGQPLVFEPSVEDWLERMRDQLDTIDDV